MKQFGYLAEGDRNSEALYTEEAITEAVKQMQVFGGLQPSGIIDDKTLKVWQNLIHVFLINRFSSFLNLAAETKMNPLIKLILIEEDQRGSS